MVVFNSFQWLLIIFNLFQWLLIWLFLTVQVYKYVCIYVCVGHINTIISTVRGFPGCVYILKMEKECEPLASSAPTCGFTELFSVAPTWRVETTRLNSITFSARVPQLSYWNNTETPLSLTPTREENRGWTWEFSSRRGNYALTLFPSMQMCGTKHR